MASLKKMARVVILRRLGVPLSRIPVFDQVTQLNDEQLTSEFNVIYIDHKSTEAAKEEEFAAQKAALE